MKKLNKCLALCMALTMLLSLFAATSVNASDKISISDVYKTRDYVINWYNSGEYYAYGHCLGFVNQCWVRSLGGTWTSACCAKKGWDTFKVSTSRDNIPIGASVYFAKNSGIKCGTCGQYAGHVGFYIGNGEIIHVYNKVFDGNGKQVYMSDKTTKAGYIKKTTIDYVINDGYTYLGWGWHSGKELEVSTHKHTYSANTEKCTECGEQFNRVYTDVNRTYVLTDDNTAIKSQPYSECGTVYVRLNSGTKVTVKRSFRNIYNNVWYEVSYGNYTGYMYSGHLKEVVEQASSTLTINLTDYPSSIKQGSSYGLRGSVTSNYNITSVNGYIINSSGSTVQSTTDTPNSTSMDIRYSNVNNKLIFNNLSAGTYTLRVTAKDSSGASKTVNVTFTVQSTATTTTTPTEPTRTGVVNIPSSWDNLSIRSGPSTNYSIVGSMNQGARCTVYTNKTSNGWYYVYYNGVYGYAAGNRITLQ